MSDNEEDLDTKYQLSDEDESDDETKTKSEEEDLDNIEDTELTTIVETPDSDEESENSEEDEQQSDDDENDFDDDNEDEDEDEETNYTKKSGKKTSKQNFTSVQSGGADSDEDDEDDDEAYLQKFNEQINKNYIIDNHPECVNINFDEVIALSKVVRDGNNNIIDNLHTTIPYLTKYEKARILGQRATQINCGMPAFIKVPDNIIDGYLIAEMELTQKRMPFIIKRPIPGGGCEYWRISDLELIGF